MRRIGSIYNSIISIENLFLADERARNGKRDSYGVRLHDRNRLNNLIKLHYKLANKTYKTSKYYIFKVYEPKERDIYRLPYLPDRIVHHAIMTHLEGIFVNTFTADTYSCIKGRGIHLAAKRLKRVMQAGSDNKYCLKIDVRKFYPTVDHEILKRMVRRRIKDPDLLALLDEIIDSADGLPIGNYLSQYLANYLLTFFDHKIKEVYKIKHYYRYADDMVFLSDDKEQLHGLLVLINHELAELGLYLKSNYRVFPTNTGIDFVGYVFYPTHTLLRKGIKKNMSKRYKCKRSRTSYLGWAKHCNSINLINTLNKKIYEKREKIG